MNLVLFYVLAGVILISAFMVVTLRNVFHSALFLVMTFFTVAGIYLMLQAEFLAAVQVLIYVGAVTILMLFAIMLTYQIQSKSIKQTNEKVIPAALISAVFLGLAVFAMTRTFGHYELPRENSGAWTASIEADKLLEQDSRWYWTATLEDEAGKAYIAGNNIALIPDAAFRNSDGAAPQEDLRPDGYIVSASSDFSSSSLYFGKDQTIYIKVWSDDVNDANISSAVWKLIGQTDTLRVVTAQLTNSNTETIGRLMMTTHVLPFEIVSVLLLVALVGAIVIARKDN